MIVSIALLGFGISGSFLYFFVNRIKDPNSIYLFFSFCFSISVIASFIAINLIPFDSFRIAWETRQIFYLVIYYLFLVLPFFFGGSFIGYVFYVQEKPGITYFYNLVGSAIGAIATIFLIPFVGEKGVVLVSTLIGFISNFVLMTKRHFRVYLALVIVFIVGLTSILIYFPEVMGVKMSPYKSLPTILRYPDSKVLYTRENFYSRVDVIESSSIKSAPGISLKYPMIPPEQLGLTIDGNNLSPITRVGKDLKELDFTEYLPISLPFVVKPQPENVLILEPRGGLDVLSCLYNRSQNVYVVENNDLIIDVLQEDFSKFSGNIYNKDNVKIFGTSSRNFARIAPVKFDLIIVSLSDSFHPVSSGAYSLNENYTYTCESFRDLIKILKEDGVLVITRWVQFPPSEDLKVLSTLLESCKKLNIRQEKDKIFTFRSWSTVTLLFKRNGFAKEEIQNLKTELKELNFDVVYYNGVTEEEVNIYNKLEKPYFYTFYSKILDTNESGREAFYEDYYFNIAPATDDKPYFFNFFKFSQFPDIIKYFGKSTQPFGGAGYLILVLALLISIVISGLLILLPLKFKGIGIKIRRDYGFLVYFFALGLGFFFIELPFVQKFILILGKPAYSLSLILFSLMLASGIGSYFSGYHRINLRIVILLLVVYIGCFTLGFSHIANFLISKDLWQRFFYTVLLIMPAGFLMGIPFPTGIARAREKRVEIIPWLWAINGCASVGGSILAVIISIHLGFLVVIGISLLLYILALVSYRFC